MVRTVSYTHLDVYKRQLRARLQTRGRRGRPDKEQDMGFFDNAQEVIDRGVSVAKGAVSGVAVEQQGFVKGFVRLCNDG